MLTNIVSGNAAAAAAGPSKCFATDRHVPSDFLVHFIATPANRALPPKSFAVGKDLRRLVIALHTLCNEKRIAQRRLLVRADVVCQAHVGDADEDAWRARTLGERVARLLLESAGAKNVVYAMLSDRRRALAVADGWRRDDSVDRGGRLVKFDSAGNRLLPTPTAAAGATTTTTKTALAKRRKQEELDQLQLEAVARKGPAAVKQEAARILAERAERDLNAQKRAAAAERTAQRKRVKAQAAAAAEEAAAATQEEQPAAADAEENAAADG